ncbi:RNA polymerase sigma (SigX) subunit [Streptohalobacillus salinus]|uniref:RNA polymerase sigma factor n=1 Tax=Streptohalobacillus salinus TaxID=621096 RepID=A0A2V3WEZ8_9BACI|nr:sigma-70 family RNA polymerase sigma factor [Streptohalobacillus salinus]PXW91708.1 RNA polymerase sigma (SigX) subunit [Streptohalobacillus salinus]
MKTTFDHLYETYHRDVYQYIFYMVKDKAITEDLLQETYIKVLQAYEKFRGESSEKTWLFSIARHTVMDYFRKQQRRKQVFFGLFSKDDEEVTNQLIDKAPLPEELTALNEELQMIYHYLDACSLDQKNVIILRFIQSLSIHETARILEWTESKVKTTQHRALKKLRHLIEQNEKR